MIAMFLATENLPFSIALVLMFGIALIEGVATVIGFGFTQFLDDLIPDFDAPDMDISADGADGGGFEGGQGPETSSIFTRFLGWVKIKQVPMLVVLVVFLTIFSLSGFLFQGTIKRLLTIHLPWYIAIWPVLLITFPLVRGVSLLLAKFVVKDETSAVWTDSFVGKIATITLGTARAGISAEAKLTDKYGQVHYIRVEPDNGNETFKTTTEVLLVKKVAVYSKRFEIRIKN